MKEPNQTSGLRARRGFDVKAMKTLRAAIILATGLGLGGCYSHLAYDFYEPKGPGKVMSDMGGSQAKGHLEFIRIDQGDEIFWLYSTIGLGGDKTPTPGIGVTVTREGTAPKVDAEEVARYLQRALSLQIEGKSHAPLRVRVVAGWERRMEAQVDFFEATQPVGQFTLRFEMRNGEERLIAFTRKHADYWYGHGIQ